nr:dynein assembly factor 1 axonemal [Hymenolepis microstoma]
MSIDTENMTFESCNDDVFYDAFEVSCLEIHKTAQEQFAESDPKHLDNLESSVTALNETYSLPNEAPILLCNQLPFLDNAIKSIKIQSNDAGIKFASVHLTNATNAESPSYYTSAKLSEPLMGCYEGLKECHSASKDNDFEIKSKKRQSDCCSVNFDGDHLKSTHDTVTNLSPESEITKLSHSDDQPDCKADMETFGESTKSLVDNFNEPQDKSDVEQTFDCFISHKFTEVEFGTLEEKVEEVMTIDSNKYDLDTSKCVLNKSYEEFKSIEIDSSFFGGHNILSSSPEKLILEPESVQENQIVPNVCEISANILNLSDDKVVSEQIRSNMKSNSLRKVDSLTDSEEINSVDVSVCTPADITVESQEEFLSIDMVSSTFEDQSDLNKTSKRSKENDIITSESELPQDILEEIQEKRKPNPPKRILSPEEDARRNKFPRMTKQILQKVCKEQKLYQTSYLNEILYLHYRGFGWIENLEDYTGLRCLFLDVNGIDRIEGLEYQTEMRCLFLSKNLIKRIENLSHMVHLDTLDISHNMISKIENLSMLPVLTKLIISHNKLETLEDIEHLRECKSLTIVDQQQNHISNPEVLEKVFAQMPNLRVLYNQGNPFIKDVKYYRKNFINQCKELTYLDDRPVFPKDRACAEAFYRGGADEENRVRKELNDAEHKRITDSCNWLSERRKKIEAANREKALAEKGMTNVQVSPDETDWLYNENQLENLGADVAESNDSREPNETSNVLKDDERGILQNADGDCRVQISNDKDSSAEELTSSNIPENSTKQEKDGNLTYSVTIDSDSSDESTIEVIRPSDKQEEITEEPNSRSIFEIYKEWNSKSKTHIAEEETMNQSVFKRPLIEEISNGDSDNEAKENMELANNEKEISI